MASNEEHLDGCNLDFTIEETTADELEGMLVPAGEEEELDDEGAPE